MLKIQIIIKKENRDGTINEVFENFAGVESAKTWLEDVFGTFQAEEYDLEAKDLLKSQELEAGGLIGIEK